MNSTRYAILLVDDDAKLLRGLERNLTDEEYTVITAVSAAEANAVLKHNHVDAIICDNQMIGISGTQFLSTVRREHPNVVRIMLTGCISPTEARKVENEIGVYRLFTKPCSAPELALVVRQAMKTVYPGADMHT